MLAFLIILSENYFSTQVTVEVIPLAVVVELPSAQSFLVVVSEDAPVVVIPFTVTLGVQTHVFSLLQEVVAKATTAATNKIIFFILVKK